MAALYNVSYSLLDDDGNTSAYAIKVPEAALTIAEIREFAQEFAAALDLVTEAQITKIAVTLETTIPGGLKATPEAQSNVQEGALFSFIASDTLYKYGSRVPAFQQDYFTGTQVDQTEVDVQAYINAMLLGLDSTGTPVIPSDQYGNDLTTVAKAYKSFRR